MRKISIIMALSLVLVFGLAMQSWAFSIEYVGTSPNYAITNAPVTGADVDEDYNAQSLIPTKNLGFTSHDGFAVIDIDPVTHEQFFFDKKITLEAKDLTGNQKLEMTFDIKNTSPFTWSDYHFFVLAEAPLIEFANSGDFGDVTPLPAFSVGLSTDNPNKLVENGETLQVNLRFDLTDLTEGYSFNLRQIATAVPVPPSALLMGSGLLGLLGFGWRRKVRS